MVVEPPGAGSGSGSGSGDTARDEPGSHNEINTPSLTQGVQAARIDNLYMSAPPDARHRPWPLAVAAVALLLVGFLVALAFRERTVAGTAVGAPPARATAGADDGTPRTSTTTTDRTSTTTTATSTTTSPTAPPAGGTWWSGDVELDGLGYGGLDFDQARPTARLARAPGSDVEFGTRERLEGHALALWRGDVPPDRARCAEELNRHVGVHRVPVAVGSRVCFATTEGRVGYVEVTRVGADLDNSMTLRGAVWEAP
ncbi:hypothetical protein [Saccharothrix australiensis]|uniref:Uncharacterized protein n=1 Tax=Saccharothrix australiensis TaxID=2072 RepID=A0A495W572_9PSEU|nr:hypothetical protein [Saccharothrix australiensis]RKT56841.1 hypothetical protein C8E97_5554 [Saccharothrix australiensis]